MPITSLSDVAVNVEDDAGNPIRTIFAFDHEAYAVYGTDRRIGIQFSDKPEEERRQRSRLAKLQAIRGQINGLVDGWRTSRFSWNRDKARRFDRRGADALVLALEGHPEEALEALLELKRDILEDRTSWARFLYLIFSAVFVMVAITVVYLVTHGWSDRTLSIFGCNTWPLFLAGAAGAMGAFFSIAIAIHNRTVLTDQNMRDNIADAFLRILIGVLAPVVLMCLMSADIVSFPSFQDDEVARDAKSCFHYTWPAILSIAFIAGFSERLIPDLLERSGMKIATPGPTPPPDPTPNGPPGRQTIGFVRRIRVKRRVVVSEEETDGLPKPTDPSQP
jgi:hypothetical protein